ncbi:MAG: hypothetical protein AAGA84_01115 [Pseudomonadota bacterium]
MKYWIAIITAALLGCGGTPDSTTLIAEDQGDDAREAAKAQIVAEHHEHRSPGKPTLPVAIDYSYLQVPSVGEPVTVRLSVVSQAVSGMSASVSTRGSMSLAKTQPQQIAMKATGQSASSETIDVVVTPSAEGRSYLNVVIRGELDGRAMTKAISVPVQVGQAGPALRINGELIETDVEVLSSMPASQSIRIEPVEE